MGSLEYHIGCIDVFTDLSSQASLVLLLASLGSDFQELVAWSQSHTNTRGVNITKQETILGERKSHSISKGKEK